MPPTGGTSRVPFRSEIQQPEPWPEIQDLILDPGSRILNVTIWPSMCGKEIFPTWVQISPGLKEVGDIKYKPGPVCISV